MFKNEYVWYNSFIMFIYMVYNILNLNGFSLELQWWFSEAIWVDPQFFRLVTEQCVESSYWFIGEWWWVWFNEEGGFKFVNLAWGGSSAEGGQ